MGTNPTNKFTQPDFTSQNAATYKANLDGAANVMKQIGAAFAPSAQDTPDMTVLLQAGNLFVAGALVEVAAQSTGTITAPASNNRIDLVYIDMTTGAVGVATGVEDAVPSVPAVPSGKLPIATVSLTTSTTAIQNTDITDVRPGYLFEDLGTAAYVDTGEDPGDVPLNSSLGEGAYVDAADQTTAETGTDNVDYMTALRVSQAITAQATQGFPTVETFTSSGTFNVPSTVSKIKYTLVGGGGAGGGAYSSVSAGGGGSGRWVVGYLDVTPGASMSVTIGAGGTGIFQATGGNGGNTSLGSVVVAGGGYGGEGSTTSGGYPGGAGGALVTSGGTVIMTGSNPGGNPMYASNDSQGGQGGQCPFGQAPKSANNTAGSSASGYGAGGGGADQYSAAGGDGAPGIAIFEYYA